MANLSAELSLFDELRDLLERERDCLTDLDIDGLVALTEAKEELTMRHRVLEGARLALARQLAGVLPGLSEGASLGETAERMGGDLGPRLLELRDRLGVVVDTVRRMSELNRRFTSHSLQCVQRALALLRGPEGAGGPVTYGASGKLCAGGRPDAAGAALGG